jgi:hypothetical protein
MMKRRLLNLLTVLSLLLCVAVCVLWVRSPRRCDYASVITSWRHFVCMTFPGGVKFSTWPHPVERPALRLDSYEYGVRNAFGAWISRPTVSWARLGFDYKPLQFRKRPRPEPRSFELFVPFWFLATLFMTPPLLSIAGLSRRRRRTRGGRCAGCGYDLRATPGRCPECGIHTAATPA